MLLSAVKTGVVDGIDSSDLFIYLLIYIYMYIAIPQFPRKELKYYMVFSRAREGWVVCLLLLGNWVV